MAFEIIGQKHTYGGDTLGYHEGRPVFVPLVLPDERVEVEAVRVAKGVVHARPLRILEPSPERIAPPCPYFGRCGGCHYQHLAAERQATVKSDILRETLRRIGKIIWETPIPIHAAPPWNYRNQAQFKVARLPDGRLDIGFFEAYSHNVFPVNECLLLSPRLNQILGELHSTRWAKQLTEASQIELLADDRDELVAMVLRGVWPVGQAAIVALEILSAIEGVVTVAVEAGGPLQVFGQPHLTYTVGEFRYQVSPGSFFQVSRFLLPDLVAAATHVEHGKLALDLFAGVGLFTLPLARRFEQVIGVESNASAAADLAASAEAHSLANIRSATAAAQDFLRRCAQTGMDLVVLDPPRAGMGASALRLLTDLRPKSVHYVSCSPPTLARDLSILLTHGYQLNSVEMFDFFPQTYHVETLARLARQGA
jgi:23S rRNA (uracil1939-C5)-methyltransferase